MGAGLRIAPNCTRILHEYGLLDEAVELGVLLEHCRRVVLTARAWGELWHHVGVKREQRNAVMRSRETYGYSFMDWIYGPTALPPDPEAEMCPTLPLETVEV